MKNKFPEKYIEERYIHEILYYKPLHEKHIYIAHTFSCTNIVTYNVMTQTFLRNSTILRHDFFFGEKYYFYDTNHVKESSINRTPTECIAMSYNFGTKETRIWYVRDFPGIRSVCPGCVFTIRYLFF